MDKLRKDNDNLKKSNESLRRERQYEKQKALNSYEASGMSYHALNQTVKALSLSKQKLTTEVREKERAYERGYILFLQAVLVLSGYVGFFIYFLRDRRSFIERGCGGGVRAPRSK